MRILGVVGAIVLLIGVGALTGGFFAWRSYADFNSRAVGAEGIVTDMAYQTPAKGKSDGTYSPIVEFTAPDGAIVHITGSVSSNPPAYSRGDHVRVLFDSANPRIARLDSVTETWGPILLLGGLGSLFALIGGGMLFVMVRQRKVRAWLTKNGMRVQAKFKGAIVDTQLSINNRNPWRLTCQWQHPVTHKVYSFSSDPIWFDPTALVSRDQLDVLVNADDPTQYQVDIAFLPGSA
jgi:Protein of unknown function (DUF3592)